MTDIFTDPNDSNNELSFKIDDSKSYVLDLVGEGKKFKDNEALARGKMTSDHFITVLQRENLELREDLKQRVTMKDVLDQLKQSPPTKVPNTEENQPPADDRTDVLKKEDLPEFFSKALQEAKESEAKKQNTTYVSSKLQELYGSEEAAQAEVARKRQELGLNADVVKRMAEEAPKAFLELFKRSSPSGLVPPNSQRTPDQRFIPGAPKTETQWSQIRKENPVYYHSEKAAIQRHSDAMSLQEAYFDKG